jgi:DeoR/GlpR family transcriptional regulator of sugar metabolism
MIAQERQEKLRRELRRHPRCSVTRLQEVLGVSRATIRRDLLQLEQHGEVVRVHGGVLASGMLRGESTFEQRSVERPQAKQSIARHAAQRVADGQTVYIDAGSTCLEVARRLLLRDQVRLVTHSVPVLSAASGSEAEVLCVGGALRRPTGALVGALAARWMEHLHVNIAFLGASGIARDHGASTTELSEAAHKQAVMAQAQQVVLCVDGAKARGPAAVRFARWDELDLLITDSLPGEWRGALQSQVQLVEAGD